MTARLTISLCLLASFASAQTPHTRTYTEVYEYADYSPETPSEPEGYNFDWLYDFLDPSDECDPNPCKNNGKCESRGGSYTCTCSTPYTGRRCQKVIDFCKGIKCGHGDCVITAKPPYYECKCRPPFQPPTCRRASPCNPNPCQNGGSCISGLTRSSVRCECPPGLTGKLCQMAPEDCYVGDGSTYEGFVSETERGEDCLFWNSRSVLEGGLEAASPEDSRLGEHNYCRNPDGDIKPWCFVRRRGELNWGYCPVKQCTGSGGGAVSPTSVTPGEVTSKPEDPSSSGTSTEFLTCGKPQPTRFTARIYGGRKAVPGAHPWQVSFQVQPQGSLAYSHLCGGTLIHPCWVLTAAHCITQPGARMRVVMGKVDLFIDDSNTQTVDVERAIVHENYRETSIALYNDIALLKLKGTDGKCTKETKYVKTACLATEKFPDATECTITGWGATPTSAYSRQLLDAKVLLISQQRCSGPTAYSNRLDDSMVCAGRMTGGIDACQGDSGGPLVCQKDGTHFLYGVVSWGDSCGKENKPGIYARVTKFTDWIKSKMEA
ncbi:hypothetical protein GJAV_G00153460 [Gymnothorax javanicus]|nr:hypothetical protein GJAV_G00153460 [Gymnothorax javanicus]